MSTPTGHKLDQFISTVLIDGVRKMTYEAGLGYLAAGTIGIGIEFLGACVDSHPFAVERQSKARFKKGIDEFMAKIDVRYATYNAEASPYYLYKQLRCGMAHIARPQGKVAFTGRDSGLKDGLAHMEVCVELDKLVVFVESFCDDFISACDDLKKRLPSLPDPKLQGIFLPVHEIKKKA